MVMSLAVAEKESLYRQKKMRTLFAVGRIHRAFKKKFGQTDCRSLCGLDLTTPNGRKELEQDVKARTCVKYVRAGARLLANELRSI